MPPAADGELEVERRAMGGDRRAFERLVKMHQASVRALGRRLSGNASEGDDIAQSAFLAAWRRRETWRGGSFRGWLCAIAYREFLAGRQRETAELQEDMAQGDDRDALDQRQDIVRAFSDLPANERAAAALCLGAGLSHSEAAFIMQAPLGSVKSWVLRGREKLKLALAAYALERVE